MRPADILILVSTLASTGLACAAKTPAEATEVPANSPREAAEANCRHELGRCGGHKPGDGSCGAAAPAPSEAKSATPTPLEDVAVAPGQFAEINLEMAAASVQSVHPAP